MLYILCSQYIWFSTINGLVDLNWYAYSIYIYIYHTFTAQLTAYFANCILLQSLRSVSSIANEGKRKAPKRRRPHRHIADIVTKCTRVRSPLWQTIHLSYVTQTWVSRWFTQHAIFLRAICVYSARPQYILIQQGQAKMCSAKKYASIFNKTGLFVFVLFLWWKHYKITVKRLQLRISKDMMSYITWLYTLGIRFEFKVLVKQCER